MQKEKLSALMDGEMFDSEVLVTLASDAALQRSWQNYHLIRDTLRGDVSNFIHCDIAARVATAIEQEETPEPISCLIREDQPHPVSWRKMPLRHKVRPWAAQLAQLGVAATISLTVITGFQYYNNQPAAIGYSTDSPVFNTLPMIGQASPVSYGVTQKASSTEQQAQRRRVNAMLQDYELQRRIYAGQLQIKQNLMPPMAEVPLSGIQQP